MKMGENGVTTIDQKESLFHQFVMKVCVVYQ